jgi:hypothetical protein
VEAREDSHAFSSIDDLGLALDLNGNRAERMRNWVVWLGSHLSVIRPGAQNGLSLIRARVDTCARSTLDGAYTMA